MNQIAREGSPLPWYERTALDADRDRLADALAGWDGPLAVDLVREPTAADEAAVAAAGARVLGRSIAGMAVLVHPCSDDVIDRLLSLPGVVFIEPLHPGGPASDVQTPSSKARPSAEYSPYTAWELGYDGSGVNLAIMDTGIDDAHPSLVDKVIAGADFSKPETLLWPRDGSFNPDDTNGHGTTCAGIATGTGAPDGVYMGAAPGASLLDLRIGTIFGYAPGEVVQDLYDAALQAIDWAIANKDRRWRSDRSGIDIISLSWGVDVGVSSDGTDVYSRALNRAVEAGIHVVVAAGNDGPDNDGFHGMGAADLVVTVAATDDIDTIDRGDDLIADYSSRGPRADDGDSDRFDELKPDIASSGTGITQAEYDRVGDGSGNGYGNRGSGTSYATPTVAGIVAMMLEANPALTPEITKGILRASAEPRGEPSVPELDPYWSREFGWGIVDAYWAVRTAEVVDVAATDPALRVKVDNVTAGSGGTTVRVAGNAWSESGDIGDLWIRVDGGPWHTTRLKDRGFDVVVPSPGGGAGVHTVEALHVVGRWRSVPSMAHLNATISRGAEAEWLSALPCLGAACGSSLCVGALIVILAVIVAGFILARLTGRSHRRDHP